MSKEHEQKRAVAYDKVSGYMATVESMEPNIHPVDASAFYASAAISLKRIADVVEFWTITQIKHAYSVDTHTYPC